MAEMKWLTDLIEERKTKEEADRAKAKAQTEEYKKKKEEVQGKWSQIVQSMIVPVLSEVERNFKRTEYRCETNVEHRTDFHIHKHITGKVQLSITFPSKRQHIMLLSSSDYEEVVHISFDSSPPDNMQTKEIKFDELSQDRIEAEVKLFIEKVFKIFN